MKKFFIGITIFAVLFAVGFSLSRKETSRTAVWKQSYLALGTVVQIQVRHGERGIAEAAMAKAIAEIRRVEALFTAYDPQSPIGAINSSAATSFSVSPEVYGLMRQCDAFWRSTSGAFDAGLGAVSEVWGFRRGQPAVPPAEKLREALKKSGWRHVRLEEGNRLRRTAPVQLDLGAMVPGYAVDRALAVLKREGMAEALVDGGGEIGSTGGEWIIGIQHPRTKGEMVRRLKLRGLAVATSGDYEQYFEKDGRRYHHILDPRTGFPATGCQSVTVLAANDAAADALSTGFFVLGTEETMRLVREMPGVHAMVVDAAGRIHASEGFAAFVTE
ncbi:MAG: Thiamine biosynthesis lipoprotein ApbE precursor [Syntrophaceae bacterium PtaU1.Bin231]|nr:MAG: Thiamine biosynthesis lipoprotein ApbE precursor [Syntrophaceae bacterium PtaU1.Bin231]